MKSRGCLLIAAGLAALSIGCGTVHFDVPDGQRVKLLTVDDPAEQRIVRHIWYVGWGAQPLGDNHTASVIATNQLTEVRLATQQGMVDNILSAITGVLTFSRRTLIVEGNSTPTHPEANP